MTNKEKYKEAFSVLQTSRDFSLEVENMANIRRKQKMNLAVAAFAACIIIGGSATAYAADVGGIQEIFSAWIHGEKVTVSVKDDVEDNGYTFSFVDSQGTEKSWGGGGVTIDDEGNETKMSAGELMDGYNNTPQVDTDDAGRVWIFLRDKSFDITDLFDEENICRVALAGEGETYYVKITREEDGSYPYESRPGKPKEDKELYTQLN
ncbi:MAG: DUF4179 domain-containing protein [Lachnospiraceae bacterium]|nr:DUF4179 domain-containing protein [Lachnospiraceae bacterium]